MRSWLEAIWLGIAMFSAGASLLKRYRAWRSLILGAAALSTLTVMYPRAGNGIAQGIFGVQPPALPTEILGVLWWVVGAWVARGILDVVLRRTLFPNDDQPHSRRLFADLIFILVYVVAFVGILDTVFKQSLSAVLATSGVLAIILGLALQNTLADILSGIAMNIDRPFRSGDWITLAGNVEGQVMEINWRATRLKTLSNSIVSIPNSVISKVMVTSHRALTEPYYCTIEVRVDSSVAPSFVFDALRSSATPKGGSTPQRLPSVYATAFSGSIIVYELSFAVADFPQLSAVRSVVISQIAETFARLRIQIGTPLVDIQLARSVSPPTGGVSTCDVSRSPTLS